MKKTCRRTKNVLKNIIKTNLIILIVLLSNEIVTWECCVKSAYSMMHYIDRGIRFDNCVASKTMEFNALTLEPAKILAQGFYPTHSTITRQPIELLESCGKLQAIGLG